MTSLIDEERFLLLRDVMEASLVAAVDGDCDDDLLLLPTAASTDSGMMDNGRNMVETKEVAMTRAIVATDFIMLLYFFVVLEVLLLEVEVVEEGRRRSSDGRKEMPNIVDASLNDLMVMWKGGDQ
jgi:hypothetical protein